MASLVILDGKLAKLPQKKQIQCSYFLIETISASEVRVTNGNNKPTLAFY
ncbi:MAG: hypothetical protein ACTS73_09490 [Arsenophonus sp. NEOnobi-MAG3]